MGIRRAAFLCAPIAAAAFLSMMSPARVAGQEESHGRVRYDLPRALVMFESGEFSAAEMGRFATLADRGVTDIDALLNGPANAPARTAPPPPRVMFIVSARQAMSQSFGRRIMLPAERVRDDSAPYLHETTHALMRMPTNCLWLSEGFASYVQSYVAEHLGGYDGVVFSRGGNANVDRLARRYLRQPRGEAALPFVGGAGEPEGLFENRRTVAEPLYVMSHSFVKYMIEGTNLDRIHRLALSSDIPASAERITGKSIEAWKTAWMKNVMEAPSAD